MFILYDIIFLIFAAFYLPVFLLRGKIHPGFEKRLGVLPEGVGFDRPVWIHAVSVGEAASIRHLVEEMRREFPGKQFVFSTVTPTGNQVISSMAVPGDFVTYLPLDLSGIVRRVFDAVNPSALVIVETELWPNLIYQASRRRIPIIVVNGRVSDGSFKRYRLIRFLLAPLLNRMTLFCVQSERDADRLKALGLGAGKVRVTGNMKFDIRLRGQDELEKDCLDSRRSSGIGDGEKLWVAASTHQGEESRVLEAFAGLRAAFPQLHLLIAPRHPERSGEVEEAVRRAGFEPVRVSAAESRKETGILRGSPGREVFILDAVGRLLRFYAIADVVFVGGSLIKKGGHNVLEPASMGKPVLFGPHMFNFRDIAALFLERKAAITVPGSSELMREVGRLLTDPPAVSMLTRAARAIIEENKGATARNAGIIKEFLSAGRV